MRFSGAVRVFELSGAAEAVAAKRPRPATAKAPMIKDRIDISFEFFLRRMKNNSHVAEEVPYG